MEKTRKNAGPCDGYDSQYLRQNLGIGRNLRLPNTATATPSSHRALTGVGADPLYGGRMLLALLEIMMSSVIFGCRGGASPPQRASPSHAVPSSVRSNSAAVVVRRDPFSVSTCIVECNGSFRRCKAVTPECEAYDQLAMIPPSTELRTYGALWAQLSERANVCVAVCGEARSLCDHRCLGAADAGLLPLP